MDSDYRDILLEVASRDWEKELQEFHQQRIEQEIEKSLRDRLAKLREASLAGGAWYGALLGLIAGLGISTHGVLIATGLFMMCLITVSIALGGVGWFAALFLSVATPISIGLISWLISSGIGWVSPSIMCLLGFASGGLMHAGIRELNLREEEKLLRQSLHSDRNSTVLDPEDLLLFWKERLHGYLRSRQNDVQQCIKETRRLIEELDQVCRELKNTPEENAHLTIEKLNLRRENQQKLLKQALRANLLLSQLEASFQNRLESVQKLHAEKVELNRQRAYRNHLAFRVERLLGQSDTHHLQWLKRREEIETRSAGAVTAFEEELQKSRDLLKAEIELDSKSGNDSLTPKS